ncbi:hypothetical protein ACK8HX_04245 [Oryzobacter sp. R7]|uniref:hypothetical protein n=1 Tax=Oryzobacter faecalis TaxID=3388656 RepID=UPI00398C8E39
MSFFERAKAAATDLAAKADVAMQNAGINTPTGGGGDRALRDLGVLAYLEATGRPGSGADRERLVAELRELESSGRLGPLTLTPTHAPGAPPPPPGAAAAGAGVPAAPPPPPAGSAPPHPPAAAPPPAPEPETTPPGSTPPPPPPSWA